MRIILYTLCTLALAVPALAQQPTAPQPAPLPNAPSWTLAETLPSAKNIHVSARSGDQTCHFKAADEASLTCTAGDGSKVFTFQRADIRKITSPRRGRSAVIGLVIGAGAGIILGAASGSSCGSNSFGICFSRGDLASGFGILFGGIGAGVGALTDFDRKTIYKAP